MRSRKVSGSHMKNPGIQFLAARRLPSRPHIHCQSEPKVLGSKSSAICSFSLDGRLLDPLAVQEEVRDVAMEKISLVLEHPHQRWERNRHRHLLLPPGRPRGRESAITLVGVSADGFSHTARSLPQTFGYRRRPPRGEMNGLWGETTWRSSTITWASRPELRAGFKARISEFM